ncbi:GNAT family N-acetyltransferase [Salipaludibacillus sp. CUR1]|uniref:GNAT family N-acetyltransferase n=1 Tax=Salipaludibacillus sp. CUR1 TaxID=2820003 RepID=UPI001E6341D5|nr:GNAT family N-acetyltransferase [Salipaludibacillus sp. CUR1]MCE7791963.1 GNAT family N-acetyltransferase [Salipaludibacillus sp. CUR1]
MDSVSLIKPTTRLEKEYLSFYNEWKQSGEVMIPWVIERSPFEFGKMVQSLYDNENELKLPKGWVPDSTYWLVNEESRILGCVNIRHKLTEKLLNEGGHIGYGIRPSERRKGYAARLLELSLEKADLIGIRKVLVVCDDYNTASRKTILRNGGIRDDDFTDHQGNVVHRFWITLNTEKQ